MGEYFIDAFNVVESVHSVVHKWMGHGVAGQRLAVQEFRVLDSLAKGEASTAGQCGRYLRIAPSRVSTIIDQLERRGFIIRQRNQPDRRLVILHLSSEGFEVYDLALNALRDNWGKVVDTIGADVLYMLKLFSDPTLQPRSE